MRKPRYLVRVSGNAMNWPVTRAFNTINECRKYTESYGTLADRGMIYRNTYGAKMLPDYERLVALHMRSGNCDGTTWYRAAC